MSSSQSLGHSNPKSKKYPDPYTSVKSITINSSRAGSGKSVNIRDSIASSGDYHNIITPTIGLNKEYKGHADQVDSSTSKGNVLTDARKAFASETNVVATQKAFREVWVPGVEVPKKLVLDEAFENSIREFQCFLFPLADRWLIDLLEVERCKSDWKLCVKASKLDEANRHIRDSDFRKSRKDIASFLEYLFDPAYITLTSREEWDRFQKKLRGYTSTGAEVPKISFTSIAILRHEVVTGHSDTILLASDAFKTEFIKSMKWQEVILLNNSHDIDNTHPNSDLVTIHYYSKDKWTASLRSAENSRGVSNWRNIAGHAQQACLGRDFIWESNKKYRGELIQLFRQDPVITSHGVNMYRHCTAAIWMPSRNLSGPACVVANELGLNADDINFARNQLPAYQFCMRTAARNDGNREEIDFFVPDLLTAEFLKEKFLDADLCYEDIGLSFQESPKPKGISISNWNKLQKVLTLRGQGMKLRDSLGKVQLSEGTYHRVIKGSEVQEALKELSLIA